VVLTGDQPNLGKLDWNDKISSIKVEAYNQNAEKPTTLAEQPIKSVERSLQPAKKSLEPVEKSELTKHKYAAMFDGVLPRGYEQELPSFYAYNKKTPMFPNIPSFTENLIPVYLTEAGGWKQLVTQKPSDENIPLFYMLPKSETYDFKNLKQIKYASHSGGPLVPS
ncbi:MAG: hypothetical protein ACKVH5_02775, partial [Fidelibacterota bacterium]